MAVRHAHGRVDCRVEGSLVVRVIHGRVGWLHRWYCGKCTAGWDAWLHLHYLRTRGTGWFSPVTGLVCTLSLIHI